MLLLKFQIAHILACLILFIHITLALHLANTNSNISKNKKLLSSSSLTSATSIKTNQKNNDEHHNYRRSAMPAESSLTENDAELLTELNNDGFFIDVANDDSNRLIKPMRGKSVIGRKIFSPPPSSPRILLPTSSRFHHYGNLIDMDNYHHFNKDDKYQLSSNENEFTQKFLKSNYFQGNNGIDKQKQLQQQQQQQQQQQLQQQQQKQNLEQQIIMKSNQFNNNNDDLETFMNDDSNRNNKFNINNNRRYYDDDDNNYDDIINDDNEFRMHGVDFNRDNYQSSKSLRELFDQQHNIDADRQPLDIRIQGQDQQQQLKKRQQQDFNINNNNNNNNKNINNNNNNNNNKQQQQKQNKQQPKRKQQQSKLPVSNQNKRNSNAINNGKSQNLISPLSHSIASSQLMWRTTRGQRQYDVPQIECPSAMDGMERFACPTPDRQGRYRCIDDHVLCDGFIDCPEGEDEDRASCMFYKTTKAHLDVLADALLRWARGR